MTASIRLLASGYDVAPALAELDAAPHLWNAHTARTGFKQGPHAQADDIWVRYNAIENLAAGLDAFNAPHESVWYAGAAEIPAVVALAERVLADVGGWRLGGVLITRIPPGCQVLPHVDHGWHAGYYEKFAIQLRGDEKQAFCFDDAQLSPLPGDLYTFDNSRMHWVTNDSDAERITLIICIRRAKC